ncbi:MAG: hypothetical protein JWQ42_969 [Edaphobacter sp.]|nr:hypothetical protein [Edaphobacter sp.]
MQIHLVSEIKAKVPSRPSPTQTSDVVVCHPNQLKLLGRPIHRSIIAMDGMVKTLSQRLLPLRLRLPLQLSSQLQLFRVVILSAAKNPRIYEGSEATRVPFPPKSCQAPLPPN